MLGTFFLERPPLTMDAVVDGTLHWVRVVGGFSAACILLWWVFRMVGRRNRLVHVEAKQNWGYKGFVYCAIAGIVAFVLTGVYWVPELIDLIRQWSGGDKIDVKISPDKLNLTWIALSVAGGLSFAAVLLPFIHNAVQMSWRRIWGLALLSFKEAVRRKVVYVFLALLLVILFATWFAPYKPEDQVRNSVSIVVWAMTPLLLLPAGLIAAFSIPTDIRKQTIHTIVTKPVQRFEIIFGRFVGYLMLLTLILFIMTTVSLFFVLRGVNPEAREESLTARQPIYGTLGYFDLVDGAPRPAKPDNVGREWGYRGYIGGNRPSAKTQHYAYWNFTELPENLDDRKTVRCEVTFDIYRTTKGREGQGVTCAFFFQTWQFKETEKQKILNEGSDLFTPDIASLSPEELEKLNELTGKYGYYEKQSVKIADFHTIPVDIPVGIIRNALGQNSDASKAALESHEGPLLTVNVRCNTPSQFIGMARYDLYLRADDHSSGPSTWDFVWNFYKSAIGLWLRLGLFIGLCVALSTQLGGIISFLCAGLIYFGGVFREFIQEVSMGKNVGGGAVESSYRLFTRTKLAMPLEDTTGTAIIRGLDAGYRALLKPFVYALPDVGRYDFSSQVANGFNIGLFSQDVIPSFLLLVGYLLPWALLAFYMLRSREIAGAH